MFRPEIFLLLIFGSFEIFGILTSHLEQTKPSYTPGIKTASWRKSDVLTHQNYSKVSVHSNSSSGPTYVVTKAERTQRVYPIYNTLTPKNPQQIFNQGSSSNETRVIYKRKIEYKQLEVYEKCPEGATGQFVYASACNQFLNCWKGRGGTVQNCAPGTLFSPVTLECDYPEKVECISGPRQQFANLRVQKSVKQASCPTGFTGFIPHYTDCSKFIRCNDGQSVPMDCPPGTLFDINKNMCDFPYVAVCFNGQSGTQYGLTTIGTSSQSNCSPRSNCLNTDTKKQGQQYQTYGQQYYQTQYGGTTSTRLYPVNRQGNCNPQTQNCGQQATANRQEHQIPISGGTGYVYSYGQAPCDPQNPNCKLIHQNYNQGSTGHGQTIYSYAQRPCDPQNPNCKPANQVNYNQGGTSGSTGYRQTIYTYGQMGCDPQNPNCKTTQQNSAVNYNQGSTGYGQAVYSYGQAPCDPQNPNCRQTYRGTTVNYNQGGTSSSTGYGQTVYSQGQTPCDPQNPNCRQTYRGTAVDYSQTVYSQTPCDPQNPNCRPAYQGNYNQGTTGYRYSVSSACDPQNPNCKPAHQNPPVNVNSGTRYEQNVQTVGTPCDPRTKNCGSITYGQIGSIQPPCDPQTQNCAQSQPSCNPLTQNCYGATNQGATYGQNTGQVRPGFHITQPSGCNQQNCQTDCNCDGSQTSSSQNYNKICNINDRNCHRIVTKDTSPKCPHGFQGLTKHPSDCKKFLSCANGMTFVMDCAPGTLFNPSLGNCDFPYNVKCDISEDTSETTTEYYYPHSSYDDSEFEPPTSSPRTENARYSTESHRQDIIDVNRGQSGVVNRPPPSEKERDYVDVFEPNAREHYGRHSTTPRSVAEWPPPYPSTDTSADYVFEYEDGEPVTVEPLNVFHAENKKKFSCGKGDFYCSAGMCITKTMVCDGIRDCDNGKDELNCEEYIGRFFIKKNFQLDVLEKQRWINVSHTTCALLCVQNNNFVCRSFNYRKLDKVCFLSDTNIGLSGALRQYYPYDYYELKTGTVDCSDTSKYFECPNNKCVDKTQVCDGVDDCGDRKDEKNCSAGIFGYSIKLVGSKDSNKGSVVVTAFGRTGYICDDQFGINDAHVICRELGFELGAADVKKMSYFANDIKENHTFYMIDDLDCKGTERSLLDCDFPGLGVHNCRDHEIAGVICRTPQEKCPKGYWECWSGKECVPYSFLCNGLYDCTDNSDEDEEICESPTALRLVDGATSKEGRVEISHFGVWGTICDDDFNENAAKIVCKQLGFKGTSIVKKEGHFGQGSGPIWLDQVHCSGDETDLKNCTNWDWGDHNCDHSEDVGVVCVDEILEVELQRHSKSADQYLRKVSEGSCGFRKDNIFTENDLIHARVVSGGVAKKGEYPWQAAIRVKVKERSAHWCGAVIISSKWVLTAAHCLQGYPKGAYVIVAGEYDTDEEEGTEQEKFIEEYFLHEMFRQGHKMNNDIALIKLKGTGFHLNDYVQPICLPDSDADYSKKLNCTISGFGSTKTGDVAYSHNMMAAWIPIQSDEICSMPHVYGAALKEGMICAGNLEGGVDACDGDSGGPLACLDQGLFTLYGVTSWGQYCGHANKPGVYVKVSHYRKWIDGIMEKNSN